MLLESITVSNFLPFKGVHTVDFSTDKEKNVTVVMGDNGSGKTSLAQAFEWCLYGKTAYKDGHVLNAEVEERITPGTYQEVVVEIKLVHDGINYAVIRRQKYSRLGSGKLDRPSTPEFSIRYKEKDAQTQYVPAGGENSRINELLSNELSHYFFFDGEHVKNMRSEIESGKSSDFANAVKSILGLKPIALSLEHLKASGNRLSVLRSFQQRFNAEDNDVLVNGTKQKERFEVRIEDAKNAIEDAIAEESVARSEKEKYQALLEEHKGSEAIMKQLSAAKSSLATKKKLYETARAQPSKLFSEGQFAFFSRRLLGDVLDELADQDAIDKGVPDVTKDTIDFLLKRRKCICGADLDTDTDAMAKLVELLKYIPPQSIGTSINQFCDGVNIRLEQKESLCERLTDSFTSMRDSENAVDLAQKQVDAIQAQFDSLNHVDLKLLRKNFKAKEDEEKRATQAIGKHRGDITRFQAQIGQIDEDIQKVQLTNANNIKVQRYINYTQKIYDELNAIYSKKESETKESFEQNVNGIFKRIYDGELWLEFDDNYGVKVRVGDLASSNKDWKTSSAQTLAIILAFIAGILKVARTNLENEEELLMGNTYPLVMDAPLSDFDTTRIKSICEVLPSVAEQVVIFIKDTDGKLAEEHLGERIGKRYSINKYSDHESTITER